MHQDKKNQKYLDQGKSYTNYVKVTRNILNLHNNADVESFKLKQEQ